MEFLRKKRHRVLRGTTLIETVITVGVFSMMALIFAQTFALATAHIADARMRSGAVAVAMQQMEQLRNRTYDTVAVQGGVPDGLIDPDKEVFLGARKYRVQTDIRYVDDPDDGTIDTIPQDTLPTDYKNVRVDVTWGDASPQHRVRLVSQFVPSGVEQSDSGGTMVINIFDAEGVPIEDADVRIRNATVSPPIDTTVFSDASGRVVVPGSPEATHYAIAITKDGYESVQTLPPYPETAFYPSDRHMSIAQNTLVTQSFTSSKLSTVTMTVHDLFGAPISDAQLHITGGRVIGTLPDSTPVYGVDDDVVGDSGGAITLADYAAGTYTITSSSLTWRLFLVDDATTPQSDTFALSQGTSPTVDVTLLDVAVPSAVVAVSDAATGSAVMNATVRLQRSTQQYDASAQTDAYGRALFPIAEDAPLENGTYVLTVMAPGYNTHTRTVTINALTDIAITLIAQ